MMDLKRACDILGIGVDATPREVRRAYRMQVRRWHPDRFANDPSGQQRAEDLLKEINEAHGFLQAEAAGRRCSPPMDQRDSRSGPAPPDSAQPPTGYAHRGQRRSRSGSFSLHAGFPALPIITFFTAWQNIIFMLLVVCTVSVSLQLHGTFFNGAGYLLRMLALPLVFALVCNFVYGGKKILWGVYAAVVSLVGIMVMLDSVRFRNEWHEAATYRYYPPSDAEVGNYGGSVSAPHEQEPFSFSGKRAPSGPVPPAPPEVTAPSVPLAPMAPAAPVAAPAR